MSVFAKDQDKALDSYTRVPGFMKEREMPLGQFK
jgi:hypothetical protein